MDKKLEMFLMNASTYYYNYIKLYLKSFNLESFWHKILLKSQYKKKNIPVLQNLIKTRIPTCICTSTYNFVRITTNDKSANIGTFFSW